MILNLITTRFIKFTFKLNILKLLLNYKLFFKKIITNEKINA